jgi:hypothetical protein
VPAPRGPVPSWIQVAAAINALAATSSLRGIPVHSLRGSSRGFATLTVPALGRFPP